MTAWKCVLVDHHKHIVKTIIQHERDGWTLHTYTAAGAGRGPILQTKPNVNHYLLFHK